MQLPTTGCLDGESPRRYNRLCGPNGLDSGTASARPHDDHEPHQEPMQGHHDDGDAEQAETEHDGVADDEQRDGDRDGDQRGEQDQAEDAVSVARAVMGARMRHQESPSRWLALRCSIHRSPSVIQKNRWTTGAPNRW